MSEIPPLRMTEEEYLEFEETAPEKHEFFNGRVCARGGPYSLGRANGGNAHRIVRSNVERLLAGHDETAAFDVLYPTDPQEPARPLFVDLRSVPAFRTYVVVDPLSPRVEVFTRNADDSWTMFEAIGREGSIKLPALGVALNLAEVFAGTEDLGPDGEPVQAEIS